MDGPAVGRAGSGTRWRYLMGRSAELQAIRRVRRPSGVLYRPIITTTGFLAYAQNGLETAAPEWCGPNPGVSQGKARNERGRPSGEN